MPPETPETPRITLRRVEDQVRGLEPEKEKRRRSIDTGPSFSTGPGQEATAKRKEADLKPMKRGRSPEPGPSREPMEQEPKKKRGRPQNPPCDY